MNFFTSDTMAPANMNVMSIMTNVLADLTQVKDPFIADDDSFLMSNGLVQEALTRGVGGTITIQERAYILSTNVASLDFGYSGASAYTPGITKLATVPNIFTIGDKKFYDKLLTQTLESGVYLNTNRYATKSIIAQIETLSADYAAKLTKYHQNQAFSACKLASGIMYTAKQVMLPYGGLYTPAGISTSLTTDLDIATFGGIFELLSRMIAPSALDPRKGMSGFATMNSLIYTSLVRNPTSYIPVSNEQILRSMSIFGDTLQFPTGQYVTLSRYSILDRDLYFKNPNYAIPQIDKDGNVTSGATQSFKLVWIDYNETNKKWQMVIQLEGLTTSDKLLSFGDIFFINNKNVLLESHGSSNRYPFTVCIDKPDGFKDEDINTHFYKYLSAEDSPYGVVGWVVNITLNINPISYYKDPNDPSKYLLSKSFSKYNLYIAPSTSSSVPPYVAFDTKKEADSLPTSEVKIKAFQKVLFGTDDPKAVPVSGYPLENMFPYANNKEFIVMWNPQTRYEIPRPIDFTYQGTTVGPMRSGTALVSSGFGINNFLGSGALLASMGPWTEEGAYNIRVGLTHTSAWLSHNFNVAVIPIDKTFIFNV